MNISTLREITGLPIRGLRPLSGGCVGQVYLAECNDGTRAVLKVAQSRRAEPDGSTLDIEGYMLEYLRVHSRLPVPRVLYCSPSVLAMEYLPGQSRFDRKAEEHAAELLADLHNVTAPRFGFERSTLIGGLMQPNPWSDRWVNFYREQRLLYMAEESAQVGAVNAPLLRRIARLADDLDKYLMEPKHPSLLHGDVWTNNVLAEQGRITGFLDPAIYYGHPEVELAFITLFHTFGNYFFECYSTIHPLDAEFFTVRRPIYLLYPLLVHARLFGSTYAAEVDSILRRIGY